MAEKLAILGGRPVLDAHPRNVWPVITEEDIDDVVAMLRRGETSYSGREGMVRELEDEFREYLGARYALATNTGTSALHSAYFGIGLGPGDEVLAPTYTFLATVMPIFAVNAVPVLVDADEWTGNIDASLIEPLITSRTKAIVITHINGYPVDMDAVVATARRYGLKVIEDCSHAHGATCNGRKVGTLGDVAAFSFQSKKLVTGGEGGVLVTSDQRVYERAVLLGHFRERCFEDVTSPEYRSFVRTGFGLNYRMHPLGAVLARNALRRLEQTIAIRSQNYEYFDRLLSGIPGVRPPIRQPYMTRVVHYSYQPLYVPEELDGLPVHLFVQAVTAEGVPVTRPNSPPLHCETVFQRPDPGLHTYSHFGAQGAAYRVYRAGDLPASEAYVARALRFPVYTEDVRPYIERWVEGLAKVAANVGALFDAGREANGRLPSAPSFERHPSEGAPA